MIREKRVLKTKIHIQLFRKMLNEADDKDFLALLEEYKHDAFLIGGVDVVDESELIEGYKKI